jgi:predicted transcriptional regulator of viral defense system
VTSPTRRDEAWHATLITATETGLDSTFDADDVATTADELDVAVSERTIRKALSVMVDFGYLQEIEPGEYRADKTFIEDVTEAGKPGRQTTLEAGWST